MRDELNQKELETFIDTHDVIYIRHNMDSTPKTYENLVSRGIAAVHYYRDLKKGVDRKSIKTHEDAASYREDSQGKKVIQRLLRYCESGAVVFADYSDPDYTGLDKNIQQVANIGILRNKSQYAAVRYETPDKKDYPFGLFYKQVGLLNYQTLSYADFALFLAIQPRGGTVSHWGEGEKTVRFVYKKKLGLTIDPKSISVELLFPAQQEVLCSEYLRLKAPSTLRLSYLLLPVGRGMKAIDIYGVIGNKRLIAQVSYAKNEHDLVEKLHELEGLAKGSKEHLKVYFGPKQIESTVHEIAHNIVFVPLEEVFDAMKDTGIIDDMLGVKIA